MYYVLSVMSSQSDIYGDVVPESDLAYSIKTHDAVVIYPTFTELAYSHNGFYDYYHGKCDLKCLTIQYTAPQYRYIAASINGYHVLQKLNYTVIGDLVVSLNPHILDSYKTVIVLHNEYVTQQEFDAVIHHRHVIYLYPNSMYALVSYDQAQNTFSLVRGHGYPDKNIKNGFTWPDDHSQWEYDHDCSNWKFMPVKNGLMLNCYPDNLIIQDPTLVKTLRVLV